MSSLTEEQESEISRSSRPTLAVEACRSIKRTARSHSCSLIIVSNRARGFKDCVELVTAIHLINPHQQMALMTAEANEVRRNLPEALRHLPVLRKPFSIEQVLRLLRQPVLPLGWGLSFLLEPVSGKL
jgi:hypothetical protein